MSLRINISAQNDTTYYKYYLNGNIESSHVFKYIFDKDSSVSYTRYEEITTYYENGQKKHQYIERNNKRDSIETEWFKNGQKRYQLSYKNGKRDGIWLHWYETGELWNVSYWKDDKIQGTEYSFFKDGKIRMITNYKDSLANGKHIRFYKNGNIECYADFKNGKGTFFYYDEKGNLKEEYYYKQYPDIREQYHKEYTDNGYKILYEGIYGIYQIDYYDKNNVKYKIIKIDENFNREVIELKRKEKE